MQHLVGLFSAGQWAAAEAQARRLMREYPGFFVLSNILGAILTRQGRLKEAVASYQKAISARPDYFEAHNNLGRT